MNILVIGSGGREHSLTWKLKQSSSVSKLFVAPGNAGTAEIAENITIAADDIDALLHFAKENNISLTVVGPELPLTMGIADAFEAEGLRIFGPSEAAAVLEASKVFTKEFCLRHHIPTARYRKFDKAEAALQYAGECSLPHVVKADGLAAGKGVYLCSERQQVFDGVKDIMVKKIFASDKNASTEVIFEEFLEGDEISILCFVDGKTIIPMETARDHKQIFNGGKGPNTGGMGVYSPGDPLSAELMNDIMNTILLPTVSGMAKEGRTYKGILYAGLMIVKEKPYLLEYNCRFGDPECQAVLMRLESDLVDIMNAVIDEKLDTCELSWSSQASVCVIMSAEGYPGSYRKGDEITGLDNLNGGDTVVFHAGTTRKEGKVLTSGGRVLGVCAMGETRKEAREKAYEGVRKINWQGAYFRTDIGQPATDDI